MGRFSLWAFFLACPGGLPSALGDGPASPHMTVEQYPVIDGSTSTQPLGMLTACRLTGTAFAWGEHFYDGSRRLYPTLDAYDPAARLALEFPALPAGRPAYPPATRGMPTNINQELGQKIEHNGTHESYVNLLGGGTDLIIAAREPSDDELALAAETGVIIHSAPVALDAFVFIVNSNNPVRNLTVDQIRAIYTGGITNWAEVGGTDELISPYQRNRNSGSQEKMEKLVMRGTPMIQSPDLEIPFSMIGPFNALRHDLHGIGYTVQYYDRYMVRLPEVARLAVDGVAPDADNIRNRTYPFVSQVFLAWRDELPAGSPAEIVRDWLVSDAGQQVVAESGYVPLR